MKMLPLLLFLFFFTQSPLAASQAERGDATSTTDNVLIAVFDEQILAFSGPQNDWVAISLKPNERMKREFAEGNIAIVVTDKRILAFSVPKHAWIEMPIAYNENLKTIQVRENIATILSDRRAIGFSAYHGIWVVQD